MATINIGNIKLNWKGAYNSSTAYVVDDVVSHNGSSYVCILASTGNAPTNATYWEQMSAKGVDADLINITGTVQGDLYYNNGSAIARLGAGTSGQLLQTNGASANPTWVTADSGTTKKLGQFTPTANTVGSVTFDNLFDDTTYQHYYISADNVSLHSDSADTMNFRWLNSSGSEATGSSYRWGSLANYYGAGGGNTYNQAGWSDDKIRLFGDNISLTSDNYRGWSCLIYIRQPNQSTHRAEIQGFCTGDDGSGASGWNSTVHGYLSNSDGINVRGFKIYTANNRYFAGGSRWTLYGVKL